VEPNGNSPESLLLSPIVRRLLSENGISESEVAGTGAGGRITREDVLKVIDARRGAAAPTAPQYSPPVVPAQPAAPLQPAASPAPAAPPAPVTAPLTPTPLRTAGDQVIPFSNMRRRTAEHMVRSKATSPHAFIANEVDFEAVERVRNGWGERFRAEEGFTLTYLPFVARAAVEALRDFPLLNASVIEDSLVVHADVNLGIAVDLSHEGLIVPVIHRAEEVTLRGVARRIRDLAERARNRKLNADDITGGTFSITNDGPFGTYFTVPIINQPQVAILATDGIARRPVVVTQPDGSESIAIHSTGIVGMSWDHRAVDGAYVSLFLARVAELLGTRDWAAEL
jgi:2-oxoglutarate dehydrogenase E2 component (dihydrolipoamide succinyltransferase)